MALSKAQKREIIRRYIAGESTRSLTLVYGVSQSTIARLVRAAKDSTPPELDEDEKAALTRLFEALESDPDAPFHSTSSAMDVVVVMMALTRITGFPSD